MNMTTGTLNGKRSVVLAALCMASIFPLFSPQLQAGEVQVGRYSLHGAIASNAQKDLLANIVTLDFPQPIQTVGDALQFLLKDSGYRLALTQPVTPDTTQLFALPLPSVHRSLGPMPLRHALETLAGPMFYLIQDPVHRLISFDRCSLEQVYLNNLKR